MSDFRGRNPRRAYDKEGREIEPMDLGHMRRHCGTREVWADPTGKRDRSPM